MTGIAAEDWVLVMILVAAAIILTSLLWIAYNSALVWDLKLEHQKELERVNAEVMTVRGTLADRKIRDMVMGSVPVGRLLDNGHTDACDDPLICDGTPHREKVGLKPDIWKGEM